MIQCYCDMLVVMNIGCQSARGLPCPTPAPPVEPNIVWTQYYVMEDGKRITLNCTNSVYWAMSMREYCNNLPIGLVYKDEKPVARITKLNDKTIQVRFKDTRGIWITKRTGLTEWTKWDKRK